MSTESASSVSSDKVKEKTGLSMPEWFDLLDKWGARDRSHKEIAKHLSESHGVDGWYAQSITVDYERARGLRGVGQACDGDWKFSYTRVIKASPAEIWQVIRPLFEAGGSGDMSLGAEQVEVKKDESPNRFLGWGDFDGMERLRVDVTIADKGDSKSALTVDIQKVPTKEEQDRLKKVWQERLIWIKARCEDRS